MSLFFQACVLSTETEMLLSEQQNISVYYLVPFAWPKSMGSGKFLNDLKEAVRKVLAEKLVIIDSEPPGLQAEWAVARRQAQAKHFLHMMLQCEDETPHAQRSRTRFVDDFVAFFPGPWTGLGWVSASLEQAVLLSLPCSK